MSNGAGTSHGYEVRLRVAKMYPNNPVVIKDIYGHEFTLGTEWLSVSVPVSRERQRSTDMTLGLFESKAEARAYAWSLIAAHPYRMVEVRVDKVTVEYSYVRETTVLGEEILSDEHTQEFREKQMQKPDMAEAEGERV